MDVQGLTRQREVRLTDGFRKCRMRMDELSDFDGQSLPVGDELRFGDQGSLTAGKRKEGGFSARILIPLRRG